LLYDGEEGFEAVRFIVLLLNVARGLKQKGSAKTTQVAEMITVIQVLIQNNTRPC
jgi:hypothetical protein